MKYENEQVGEVAEKLFIEFDKLKIKSDILKSVDLRALYKVIPTLPAEERASFGQEINTLKDQLQEMVDAASEAQEELDPIDVTAPMDVNAQRPELLPSHMGSQHPITTEIQHMSDIFRRMGFVVHESRQLDDDYHMFESLNFPEDHPARDDYDTFMTKDGLIAPAHTSTMQNRILKKYKANLEAGQPIAAAVPDRVFRNEDLDATHEHTFYQHEGIFIDEGVHAGHLLSTLKAFLNEYFEEDLQVKLQPFYFPFTEPSFELAVEMPSSLKKEGAVEADQWLELLGCGMIHPNVLKMAGIDPIKYSGFAWGGGVERLIMMKYGIEDIRHFNSGRLEFLRQF